MSQSFQEYAIELVAPRKFHQIFTLPATDKHNLLKVTYSITGPVEGDVPTVLFVTGMFGTRLQGIGADWLAEKEKVRILFIDRPGFGGSTLVPVSQRIPVYLETVPLLLAHLNIKHISIASHSSGTIFALNLLHHRPDLLVPNNPNITLFSPWVHQSHSSVSVLQAASMLPNPFLNHWNGLMEFIGPSIGASNRVISSVTGLWKDAEKKEQEETKRMNGYGFGVEQKTVMDKVIFKYVFAENTAGANDEARLCLRSVVDAYWDVCEDYPVYIQNLNQSWTSKIPKLKFKAVFGESDVMIGTKGRKYFENTFTQENCGDGIVVQFEEVKGGDHDSVVNPDEKCFLEMLRLAKMNG